MISKLVAAVVLALMLGAAGGYWKGHADGALGVQAEADRQAVAHLTALIEQTRTLTTQAHMASQRILSLAADRQAYDRTTTQALQEVLNDTAALRRECVFDDRVMRELDDARERAAQAAAGGLDGAVPATGETGGR